jgi:AbrB family looped-hinge helix DNA binding protein
MMVTVDRAGRIVIPKDIRDRLSLGADAELEIDLEGNSIRLTPLRGPARQIVVRDGLPVLERIDGQVITDADVQRWRDADQR